MSLLMPLAVSANNEFWNDPTIVDQGKEPARASFVVPSTTSLNGTWKFKFAPAVDARQVDFYSDTVNVASWGDIIVPASWETQGYGIPVYSNSAYIFPVNPPFVPADDLPIGTYRRTFTVPESFAGKQVILHFGSIAGAATIYVNGQKVGYSKASKTPAEFNITNLLKNGDNTLALQIFKWSDASYLEDQDFWRLAGIERDVTLIARPNVSIEDIHAVGNLDDKYTTGLFSLDVAVRNFTSEVKPGYKVDVALLNSAGSKVFSATKSIDAVAGNSTVSFDYKLSKPQLWSAEHPNLYTVKVRLLDNNGAEVEATQVRTGFRRVEMKNKQLLINGVPIIIRGVNIHEHSEDKGHYVDHATRLKDFELWKLNNFNALRTCHYSQDDEFYEMADEYGFYIVDEANIENHGLDGYDRTRHPSFVPEYAGQIMDRTVRMYQRDKNHPSVIVWSLGNESDCGDNFQATYRWLKATDTTRPTQYHRARETEFTDIFCPMYPTPAVMERYATRDDVYRPIIPCEYEHAMGNSNGQMKDYWELIMRYPIMQGGFIWDWVDQGLTAYDEQGRKYWAYGGDLGGHRWTHDENFCDNGLVNADRTIHPALHEVKMWYSPVWFADEDVAKGKILIHNYNLFTSLKDYDFKWVLIKNGEPVDSARFSATAKPMTDAHVALKLPKLSYAQGDEYFLNLYAVTTVASPLVPAGHVVAFEQISFPGNNYFVDKAADSDIIWRQRDRNISFSINGVEAAVDVRSGCLSAYNVDGQAMMVRKTTATPNFWRAPTDNDFGYGMPREQNVWRTAGDNTEIDDMSIDGNKLTFALKLVGIDVPYTLTYEAQKDGSIIVTSEIDLEGHDLPEFPRYGMKMVLPTSLDNVNYYGRGPWENYQDRNTSSFIGRYNSTIDGLNFDYIRPQENGYRTDVREVSFTDATGKGIRFTGVGQPICFNARHNYDADLDPGLTKKQQHSIDIDPRDFIAVNIDLIQAGLGGTNSWSARPLDQYRLLDKHYKYSYRISPVR
jgi:beta-galactosidase